MWVCMVCGYVHRGSEPPETCPVCGAPASDFEKREEKPAEPAAVKPTQWRCLICGYVHVGPEPPTTCPVCGALADDFEALAEKVAVAPAASGAARRVVILGAGIAGLSAAEAAREASPDAEITLISKEPDLPYYRLNLTRYLAGEIEEAALPIHPEAWYAEQRIRLLQGTEATAIDLQKGTVDLGGGNHLGFDRLIVTCGAHPFIPPIPGAEREGVTVLRTLAHAQQIRGALKTDMPCVCIGGGILGLETAGALVRHGVQVTLLEGYDWLLPRQLNQEAGRLLERHVEAMGITIRRRSKPLAILGDKHVQGITLENDTLLPAQLAVIATGVRSNSHLARRAGLEVKQGIVVNSSLSTAHPSILAAGDVAEHHGTLYGLWEPARYQGTIAGMNAVGQANEFGGLPRTNTLKVLGIDLFSIGAIMPTDASFDVIHNEQDGSYYRFLFKDGRLAGAILLGDTALAGTVAKALKEGSDFSALLGKGPTASDVCAALAERGAKK